MPVTNAISKHGTFIYDARETVDDYGSPAALAAAAQAAGMTHAWVRIHGIHPVSHEQATRAVIQALQAKNIAVAGWGWLQGDGVAQEAQLALQQLALYGLTDYVADIEHGVNNAQWTPQEVDALLSTLRPKIPGSLVVSTFPVIQWHEPQLMEAAIPYVDAFAPQAYWFHFPNQKMRNQFQKPGGGSYTLDSAAEYVNLTIDLWRKLSDKPLVLTGQAYWGEGIGQGDAQAKLDQFLSSFSRWGDIHGFNWWHFGGGSAMSHHMLDAISSAELGQKTYAGGSKAVSPAPVSDAQAHTPAAPEPAASTGVKGGDSEHIPDLLKAATTRLADAQKEAAQALKNAGEPPFPKNGCAATLSALLRMAGIQVPMTLGAGVLAHILGGKPGMGGAIKCRGWEHIPVGQQNAGDVGVTYDLGGNAGADHIYLVVEPLGQDEMVIADNQDTKLHHRFASGKGKTPDRILFARRLAACAPLSRRR